MITIYLLHFAEPYHHAQHYLGATNNLPRRLQEHTCGTASALTAAVASAGIGMDVVRTWEAENYGFEQHLKARHDSRALCPICNPKSWHRNANGGDK